MKLLEKILQKYAESDFVLQQKARVIAVICLLMLCIMPIILVHSYSLMAAAGGIKIRVVIPELAGILMFALALLVLVKGYYQIAAHLLIISALSVAWAIMFVDRFSTLVQMDTIVYVMAVMATSALFVYRQKYAIPLYFIVNESLLVILVLSSKEHWGLSSLETRDYIMDNTIAMMFISLVAYNVIALNRRALDRAEADIARRAYAEKELRFQTYRYSERSGRNPAPDTLLLQRNRAGPIEPVDQCRLCLERDPTGKLYTADRAQNP